MKIIVLLLTLASFSGLVLAQGIVVNSSAPKSNGQITGMIVDAADNKSIPYATITLANPATNKAVEKALANAKGVFTISSMSAGTYTLIISSTGYNTKTITNIKVAATDSKLQLGSIKLSTGANNLNEVTVVGKRALIEEKVDRLVYNAENDVSNRGGDATDVLRKVPMLSVDLDGNVSMRGSQNVKVLINNRPSTITAGSIADAMKQIPSDMIKSVEVITSPSAKYDAEGSAGIINIITKKNTLQGGSLSIDAASGLRGSNLGLNGSYKTGKMDFSLGGRGRAGYNTTGSFENLQTTGTGSSNEMLTSQQASTNNNMLNGRYSFGWDYDIDKNNFLSSSVEYGVRNFNTNQNGLLIQNFQNSTLLNSSLRDAAVKDNSGTVDINLNYTHSFAKPQQEISVLGLISRNNRTNNFLNTVYNGDFTAVDSYLKNINESINQETTVQVDYQNPIGKSQLVEFGAKEILRNVTSDYQTLVSGTSNVYTPVLNDVFNYDQNITAGYLSYTLTTPSKYSFKSGVRYEYTTVNAAFENAESPGFNSSYAALVPSLNVSKRLESGNTLKLAYNRRIQRPSLQFLNPNVQAANPLNITIGNPNLNPEYTNNFELGYSTFIKNSSLSFSAFVRNTNNSIQSIRDLLGTDTIRTTFANIGQENAYGLSIFTGLNLSNKLTLNGGVDTYYAVLDNKVSNPLYTARNEGLVFNMRLQGSYQIGNGWSFEGFGFYRAGQVQLQGTQGGFGVYNLNLRKDINQKRGTIGLGAENFLGRSITVRNALNTPIFSQSSTDVRNNLSFRISFSYRIGKLTSNQGRQRNKKSITNDDLKEGGDSGQDAGGAAGQSGGQAQGKRVQPKAQPKAPKNIELTPKATVQDSTQTQKPVLNPLGKPEAATKPLDTLKRQPPLL
jgi:outer membrane receptor protein involved in Fe transport